jgi:hypothetical protein
VIIRFLERLAPPAGVATRLRAGEAEVARFLEGLAATAAAMAEAGAVRPLAGEEEAARFLERSAALD